MGREQALGPTGFFSEQAGDVLQSLMGEKVGVVAKDFGILDPECCSDVRLLSAFTLADRNSCYTDLLILVGREADVPRMYMHTPVLLGAQARERDRGHRRTYCTSTDGLRHGRPLARFSGPWRLHRAAATG